MCSSPTNVSYYYYSSYSSHALIVPTSLATTSSDAAKRSFSLSHRCTFVSTTARKGRQGAIVPSPNYCTFFHFCGLTNSYSPPPQPPPSLRTRDGGHFAPTPIFPPTFRVTAENCPHPDPFVARNARRRVFAPTPTLPSTFRVTKGNPSPTTPPLYLVHVHFDASRRDPPTGLDCTVIYYFYNILHFFVARNQLNLVA